MHYKKNFRNKVHSTSFYIDEKKLENLSFIAQLEAQSRSVIVERSLLFLFSGGDDAWRKSKRVYAKKKKIHTTQKCLQSHKQRIQSEKYQQECFGLFSHR